MNYVDPLGLESLGSVNAVTVWIENTFTGEVINDTNYYLFIRTENDKAPVSADDLKNFVTTNANTTLTESLGEMKISVDGIVFPDRSVYKGWSGSKVTITEKNGNFNVKPSVGTAIANGIGNIVKFVQNLFLPTDQKKEYYGYYSKEKVAKMKENNPDGDNSIIGWIKQIDQSKHADYFEQNQTVKSSKVNAIQGCTK